MTEKYVYKVSRQGKACSSDLSFGVIVLPIYFSSEFSENIFLKWKKRIDRGLIYQLENLTLGALSYLHVGTSSGGSRLKPKIVLGHGWVERGSSQVIRSSNTMVRVYLWIVNAGYLSVQVSAINIASIYRYASLDYLFHFLK